MKVRRAAGAVALATLAPLTLAAPEAAQADALTSSITAHVTDVTPASGQTFRVFGRLTVNSRLAVGHLVKIQELRHGTWLPLKGAQIRTNSQGRYRLRLILTLKGKNVLRAVGVTEKGHRNAYKRFSVTVH